MAPAVMREHASELERLAGVCVELVDEGERVYALLHGVPLPDGLYTAAAADALFIGDQLYPRSALDMFWLDDSVRRRDGRAPAGTESVEHHLGRMWRRYSWHRGAWNPNANGLLDHYELMQDRLAREAAA